MLSDLRKLIKNIRDQVELAELDLQSEDAHDTLRFRLQFVEEFARLGQQSLGQERPGQPEPLQETSGGKRTSATGKEPPPQEASGR